MRSVQVRAGPHRYEALIGVGLLEETGTLVRRVLHGPRCALLSDANVAPLATRVLRALERADFSAELITMPPGEASKSFAQVEALCAQLGAAALDRSSFLISLGGGMVGDLAGFVASIFLRGIPYVALPTTLLAQVDACLGGKTGINSSAGKNLIGSFHHPALILADTDALHTLPERVWNEGLAEAIKHGIIRDAGLFDRVAQASSLPTRADASWKLALPNFIARNLSIKAAIVAEDERDEKGIRALLNFGHTFGHAIEHAGGYERFLHGEALSLGMVAAARVSVARAGLSLGECERIIATLRACRLPVTLPADFPRENIFAALPRDKKFEHGRIRFVVAHEIGRASVSEEVTMDDLRAAVAAL